MHIAHIAMMSHSAEKRVQTCAAHCRGVAALARDALAPLGLGQAAYLAGLIHDCGKFTSEFDEYITKAAQGEQVRKGSVIHTFAGCSYLLRQFHTSSGSLSITDIASEVLFIAVASHHGLIDLWDNRQQNGFDHRLQHQPAYDGRALEAFFSECADQQELHGLYEQAKKEIMGFYQEKLASCVSTEDEMYFAIGQLARLITSALVDADRTDTRCFMQNEPYVKPAAPPWQACARQVNAYVASFPRSTPIQAARADFSDLCAQAASGASGLYRLDLPTGGGKTLTALRFAVLHAEKNQMERVLYVAPLLSILDQNAREIRRAVGDSIQCLEHHSNLLHENETPEETQQIELLQETWSSPLIITTFVQLLNTMFSGKMSCVRRFHRLSRSVIIIDEVQSLPPKLLSMFNCTVNFLVRSCGATVVLCSATQPAFSQAMRKMLPARRLISQADFDHYAPLFKRTTITDAGAFTLEELAAQAQCMVEGSHSLLIVCNTKRQAASLYETLSHGAVQVFHLSAGMCMSHRKDTLSRLTQALDAGERLICVSTQLIEAGVDVSFGSVIRLSAGLDNVVQAAGRCNRHGEHPEPQAALICRLKDEKLGSLREIKEAQNALTTLLEEYHRAPQRYDNDLSSDAAVKAYYTFLYRSMDADAQDYVIQPNSTARRNLFSLLSTNQQMAGDDNGRYFLGQSFRTAGELFEVFDAANESVLVPYKDGKGVIDQLAGLHPMDWEKTEKLLGKAKAYTVSVPMSAAARMKEKGMLYTLLDGSLLVLNADYYDECIGIKEGNDLCSIQIL